MIKDEFIPLMRIEARVKDLLIIEAERQGRTLTNYVQFVLNKDAARLSRKRHDKGDV